MVLDFSWHCVLETLHCRVHSCVEWFDSPRLWLAGERLQLWSGDDIEIPCIDTYPLCCNILQNLIIVRM